MDVNKKPAFVTAGNYMRVRDMVKQSLQNPKLRKGSLGLKPANANRKILTYYINKFVNSLFYLYNKLIF